LQVQLASALAPAANVVADRERGGGLGGVSRVVRSALELLDDSADLVVRLARQVHQLNQPGEEDTMSRPKRANVRSRLREQFDGIVVPAFGG
jgi:hypothetical protein